jgi:murein DD-endopeptidase MepM/ murein hydrolase activator NlpD
MREISWERHDFHPAVLLPPVYDVLDFTGGESGEIEHPSPFAIGRYDEVRPGVYDQDRYGTRHIHMGIDIAGPVGTPVHAVHDGTVFAVAYHGAPGDYGNTVITHHVLDGADLWILHGHLDSRSVARADPGQPVARGEVIGWLGDRHENGGWPPHLHLQLSRRRPEGGDLPGAVAPEDRERARRDFPDPRLVLGPLY